MRSMNAFHGLNGTLTFCQIKVVSWVNATPAFLGYARMTPILQVHLFAAKNSAPMLIDIRDNSVFHNPKEEHCESQFLSFPDEQGLELLECNHYIVGPYL